MCKSPAVVSMALLAEHSVALAPRWLATEGFTKGGCGEAYLLTMRVVNDRCSE